MRHTKEQRELLYKAWNNGELNDCTNYGKISQLTGLSRKQVSNWARYQMKKHCAKHRPSKAETNDRSIIRISVPRFGCSEFCPSKTAPVPQSVQEDSMNISPHNIKPLVMASNPSFYHCMPPLASIRQPTNTFTGIPSDNYSALLPRITSANGKLMSHNGTLPRGSHNMVCSDVKGQPMSLSTLRDLYLKNWFILNAMQGISEVDAAMVRYLEMQTGISSSDIVFYLLRNGWKLIPMGQGVNYGST